MKCTSCGKKYQRTASMGFNDMATAEDRAEYRLKLKLGAEKYSREEITCNACIKKAIGEAMPLDLISAETLSEIAILEKETVALNARKRVLEKHFRENDNRLFLYRDEIYVQSRCGASFSPYGDEGFGVFGHRISKTHPRARWYVASAFYDDGVGGIAIPDGPRRDS